MRPLIESSKPNTTLEEINVFEKGLKRDLPQDYKSFLLDNNGGKPIPNRFNFINKKREEEEGVVFIFFNIGEEKYSLDWYRTIYKNRILKNLLPIADNGFGDKYCISLKKKDYGSIYIWYHEFESGTNEKPNRDNLFKLADDFSSFINDFSETQEILKEENPKIIEYCIEGNLKGLSQMIEENTIDINGIYGDDKSNPMKRSLLGFAIFYNQIDIVRYFLSLKVNTEGMLSMEGLLNLEIAKLLVTKGANINEKDQEGYTPLIYSSCFNESYDIAEYLLKRGAIVDEGNPNWKEGISYAKMMKNKKTLQFLKERIGLPNSLFI